MKCSNCGYVSFDNLDKCKNCATDLKPIVKEDLFIEKDATKELQISGPPDFFRPAGMDETFESIKSDLKEIDRVSADGTAVVKSAALTNKDHHQKNAGFFGRLLAYTIDNIILCVISIIFFTCGYLLLESLSLNEANALTIIQSIIVPCIIANIIIEVFYFTYFHGVTGQTPGKSICGLKVVGKQGSPLGFKYAFLRYIGYIISRLTLYIGFLWIAFDLKKQGWHDKIAGSYVIKVS